MQYKPLLQLGFLVSDMLANHGIKLLDLHFFWHGALVFGRGVICAAALATGHLDDVSH